MKVTQNDHIIKGRVLSADGTLISPPAVITETPLLKSLKTQLTDATNKLAGDRSALASTQASRQSCYVPFSLKTGLAHWNNTCLSQNNADTAMYSANVSDGESRVASLTAQIAAEQKNIETANTTALASYNAQLASQVANQNYQTANNPIAQKQKADADQAAQKLKQEADVALANLNNQTSLAASAIANKKYIIIGVISTIVIIIIAVTIYLVKRKKG